MQWVLVKVVGSMLANPDGTVRSLNPASNDPPYGPYHWETRPAGANGGYEVCAINGSMAVYNPSGKDPQVYGFCQTDPRNPGFSCLTVDPL